MTDKLFDRQNYLGVIAKRVEGLRCGYRQNIALIGYESIGKTSIMLHFLNNFYDSRIIPVYLDIRYEPLDYFVRRFIGAILYSFLKESGIAIKEDLEFLMQKSQRHIPHTVERIRYILSISDNKKDNILSEVFSLCESINQETTKACLVIFDEFQNLESMGLKNLYKIWSKAIISQKNTMFIIMSSASFKARSILSNNLSLLFGNFELLDIGPFDLRMSSEFIETLLRPANLLGHHRDFLINFTGGHPYYLKVICQELLKVYYSKTQDYIIDDALLIQTLRNILFDEMGVLNLRFSNFLKAFTADGLNQEYTSILHQIACGHNRIKDLSISLHKTKKSLLLKINRLIELDIIEHNGDFFKMVDRLFSFWLRFVYQERLMVFSLDAKNQVDVFKNKILSMMNEFISDAKRPILNRMTELLQLFGDESISVGRKRLKLTQFREIKPLRFCGKFIKEGLLGRSSEGIWIIAFKEDHISEEDVTEFASECRKYRNNRMQKRIIISCRSIDSNARLKALEEKIMAWDIDNMNSILDLFNKSRIIAV